MRFRLTISILFQLSRDQGFGCTYRKIEIHWAYLFDYNLE